MANNLYVGKAVMIFTNFLFLLAGLVLVSAGIALLMDSPRILLSRLILPAATGVTGVYIGGVNTNLAGPSTPPPILPTVTSLPQQPIFYYAALIAMALGTVVCAVAVLGCWAARLRKCGILTAYLFVLSLMLLGELSVIILSVLAPQLLGLVFDSGRLLAVLQRGYGTPGSEQLTAALDLAQATMECCGVRGPSDYNASGWRLRELGRRELRVPLSCCHLANADQPLAFLDPRPTNQTLCQSPEESSERHQEGCGIRISEWLSQQVALVGAAGGGLLVLQLVALFVAIFVCVQLAAYRSKPLKLKDGTSSGHINAAMTDNSGAGNSTEDDGDGTEERQLPLHETQLGIDPPLYGTAATKELPLSASALVVQQEGPPVPAAPAGYGVYRTTPMPASPRRSQPPRPPPKPSIVPSACGCDMLYYQQTNQLMDPGLYQYVEELRAAEELRSSPYQQALVTAARRSTHGRSRRQNRSEQQQIYQQPMQHNPQLYQHQSSHYLPAQHHTLQPTWQPTPLYEVRPSRTYQDNQAQPQQPRQQHDSVQQPQKHAQQSTWQQKQQLHEQHLQQKQIQQLQQQQLQQQQQQHLQQQQQLQEQQLQLQQQQLQQQQLQQQQLQIQKQLQQEQQQMKQLSYHHKNEDELPEKYEHDQTSQELIQQDYVTKQGTLVGNGKIGRHEAVPVAKPIRPA